MSHKESTITKHELQHAVKDTERALSYYAQVHESLFGAPDNGSVMDGVLSHFEEGKFTEIKIGPDPTDVQEVTVAFDRGAPTQRGRKATDIFTFKPGQSLTREMGDYSTDLITFDPESGEAVFPQGIGAKRQKIAMTALQIIQDNFSTDVMS